MAVAAGCSVRGAAVSSLCSSDAENSGVGLGWGTQLCHSGHQVLISPKGNRAPLGLGLVACGNIWGSGEYMEGNLLHVFSLS